MYTSREEQGHLLQQVLSASDMDADEERIPGEGPRPVNCVAIIIKNAMFIFALLQFIFQIMRKAGNMTSMSGADDAVYYEYRKAPGSSTANKHPLFKKFRA